MNSQPKASLSSLKHLSYSDLDILHSLRGFCAFYVVVFHAKYILWSGGRQYLDVHPRNTWSWWDYPAFLLDMLSSAGYEMVIFFFVLSGFFIRYAQLKKHRGAADFYVNRIVRIYPPYLFSAFLAAISVWLVAEGAPKAIINNGRELNEAVNGAWQDITEFNILNIVKTLGFLPLNHVYIGYNDVYWSLLPEALFYLAVPLAFWRVKVYYVLSIVVHVIGLIWVHQALPNPLLNYLFTYNIYFAVGAMLYDVIISTSWISWVKKINIYVLIYVIIFLFVVLLGLALLKLKPLSGLVAVVLAVASMSTLLTGKIPRENLLVKALHQVGVFSFSLYLYHFPLLLLCYGGLVYLTGEVVFYARYYWLALPIVTSVAYLLYYLIERRSINYFRKV
jgi:peptidoglycan/LPS O-acetylase OafA/YrhL